MPKIDLQTYNTLKESTGEDFIGELVDAFFDDAPSLIAQMRSALAEKNAESFRRAAHSMKSNAATFGAMELSALAKELESLARENNLDVGNRVDVIEAEFQQAKTELLALKA
jgi:HPt (histidine-containing phosphotransfer) domain-containing protein